MIAYVVIANIVPYRLVQTTVDIGEDQKGPQMSVRSGIYVYVYFNYIECIRTPIIERPGAGHGGVSGRRKYCTYDPNPTVVSPVLPNVAVVCLRLERLRATFLQGFSMERYNWKRAFKLALSLFGTTCCFLS